MAKRTRIKPLGEPTTSPQEYSTIIDPADGFHKALDKLTPKQMARLIARISANSPPLPKRRPPR